MKKNVVYLIIFAIVFGSFYIVGELWLNAIRPTNTRALKQPCEVKEVIVYKDKIIEKPVIKEVIREVETSDCPEPPPTPAPPKCPTIEELQNEAIASSSTVPGSDPLEFMKVLDFKEPTWRGNLEKRLEHIWKDYKRRMPTKFEYPEVKEDSTSANVYEDPNGFTVVLLSNVCYNVNKAELYIYTSSQEKGKAMIKSFGNDFYDGFQFTLKLAPYSNTNAIATENNWMIISHSQRNIAHILEAVNYVLHVAHFPSDYPPIEKLFLPRLKLESIFPWVGNYLDLLKELFPEEFKYQQYDFQKSKKIAKKGLLCFNHLGISSRLHHVSYGGVFISSIQVDTMRAIAYRRNNLEPSELTYDIPMIALLERANVGGNLPGRHIANMRQLERFFQARRYNFRYKKVILENLTPKKQIEAMMNSDVLLGALGSGFTNVMFMVPGSVAIIVSPPYIGGFFFHSMTELSNVWYLPMYNYSTSIPNECVDAMDDFGHVMKSNCGKFLYAQDIYIVPGVLENYMKLADVHLKMYKYPKWQAKRK